MGWFCPAANLATWVGSACVLWTLRGTVSINTDRSAQRTLPLYGETASRAQGGLSGISAAERLDRALLRRSVGTRWSELACGFLNLWLLFRRAADWKLFDLQGLGRLRGLFSLLWLVARPLLLSQAHVCARVALR